MNNSFNNSSNNNLSEQTQNRAVIKQLNILITNYKRRILFNTLLNATPWLILVFIIGKNSNVSTSIIAGLIAFIYLGIAKLKVSSHYYRKITIGTLLQHLNRHHAQLQESAQLIIQAESSLSILQVLQKQHVKNVLESLLTGTKQKLLPVTRYQPFVISSFAVLLILLSIYVSNHYFSVEKLDPLSDTTVIDSASNSAENVEELILTQTELLISPPAYTELAAIYYNDLNATLISGSKLRWKLTFSQPNRNIFIIFANGEKVYFNNANKPLYILEQQVYTTGVYRLGERVDGTEKIFPEIYTLTVTKDKKPKIKIITPEKTITEIAKNGALEVSTTVQVSDDFKISKVEILASIAKGSGEAVKFRDQVFTFDSKALVNGLDVYSKNWQLTSLGMEPGDEMYFTVKAWDNRQPEQQLTRSVTKIIRWLEDETQLVMSDGILIDFMPEYFKSQRQIIIDTIELIEDRAELTKDVFVETSELLGVAQSELKEKYGQYLGDEVEDGGGSHAISHEAHEQIESVESSSEHHESEHHHDEAGGHESDGFEMNNFGVDKSGRSELINQFGHNHEDADIGIMARQDPKALMKRSIANMWQAELHLMLSEPSKALPFEQEALKYLKMAKKAERIYVKRLGFEPPPVSEQRRYQGDLSDVLSYKKSQYIDMSETEERQLSQLFSWLNTALNQPLYDKVEAINQTQRALIIKVKEQFERLLDKRPALIKYVAILERMLGSNSLVLPNCQNCLVELTEKLWQLLPEAIAKPMSSRKSYIVSDEMEKQYNLFLMESL